MGKYDYSGFTGDGWKDSLTDMHFWGLHHTDGKIEVDVDRFIAASEQISILDFVPDEFSNGKIKGYYIPTKEHRWDYICNYLIDMLEDLKSKWRTEYKPLFRKITTPSQVEHDSYLNQIAFLSDSDMYDECEIQARLDGIRRISEYERILNEMYCMFISKICCEIDRYLVKAIALCGYTGKYFDRSRLQKFCKRKNSAIALEELEGYKAFTDLHNVNNFIKHCTVSCFNTLVEASPDCLRCREGYENGMYSGDWLDFKEADIDRFLSEMTHFFNSLCSKVFGEDVKAAKWDYEDYFTDAFEELQNPDEYLGFP